MKAVKRGNCSPCRYTTDLASAMSDKDGYSTTKNCPKCGNPLKLSGSWYARGIHKGKKIFEPFPTKKEAELFISKCLEAKHTGSLLPKQEVYLTWGDGKKAFQQAEMKDKTREFYDYTLSVLDRQFGDKEKLIDVTPSRVMKLTDKLKKDGLSARTIAGTIGTVKRMFVLVTEHLKAQDYPRLHEAKTDILKLKKPPVDNFKDDYFTAEEVKRLISVAPEHLALYLRIQIETGLRPGNVYSLRFSDIAEDGTITLASESMKSGKAFTTSISSGLRKDLIQYAMKHGYRTWLFPSPANNPVQGIDKPIHDIRTAWNTAMKAAGLTGTPHKIRHSFASILLNDGVPLVMVSELMNHADIGITKSRYGHLDDEGKKDALREYRERLAL